MRLTRIHPYLVTAVAILLLFNACVEPFTPVVQGDRNRFPEGALVFSPEVLGVPLTKAEPIPGDDNLMENKLATLDIFVYRKVSGGNEFFHRYTLTDSEAQRLVSGQDYLLESDWRSARYGGQGYENNSFKIYVLANMAVNIRNSIPDSPTENQLRDFVSTSKQTISGSYDVVRLVDGVGPGTEDRFNPHIADNLFLMDGVIDDWRPVASESQQFFTAKDDKTFELRRAAAKFKITLDFDPAFLALLGTPDDDKLNFTKTEYWPGTETKMKEVVTHIGNFQYKYSNFLPATYDFDPANAFSPNDLKTFRDANLWESTYRYDFSSRTEASTQGSYKYPYEDITYSYAFSWDADEAAEKAPALGTSVIYTTTTKYYTETGELDDSRTTSIDETNYYRIPLVNVISSTDPVKAVERNTFYQVDARISSMGATTIDIEPTDVKLSYKVIPWQFNKDTDVTEVEGAELLYFTADTTFTLRGDKSQTTNLDYFTPKSELLSSGLYLYEPTISNVHVYYKSSADETTNINVAGSRPGTYSNGNTLWTGTKANSNERVTITVVPAPDGGGVVRVTSDALANRAVKYIEFDASVTFHVPILDGYGQPTGEYNDVTVKHHYLIKHFPLDNIQSVMGWWSSRWDRVKNRQYSWDPVAGWSTETAYFSYSEYNADRTHISRGTETTSNNYYDVVTDWGNYNSEANSYFNQEDGYCYWRTGGWNNRVYHRIQYSGTRYYKDIPFTVANPPSTGTWVAYSPQKEGINEGTLYDGSGSGFDAKVWDESRDATRLHQITTAGTWGSAANVTQYGGKNNPHMYVIQISKAENNVNLGRPQIDPTTYQSSDNVVSPAFMIASQLGAVSSSTYTAATAAKHCSTYMEVAGNGRRFVGWRLPTASEIAYIKQYQENDAIQGGGVFERVLTGRNYYNLSGGTSIGNQSGNNSNYVRCIRDLTPEEVAELNSTGTITTATY